MKLTTVHNSTSVLVRVVEPKHKVGSFGCDTWWGECRVPLDELFGADLPDCAVLWIDPSWEDNDGSGTFPNGLTFPGGMSIRQCGRRRDDGEDREKSGKELHYGSS